MKTSVMMRCPKCDKTSELDNLHLLDRSFKREWVGLTDEERDAITDKLIGFNSCWGPEEDFARAIEAKLKEKNT